MYTGRSGVVLIGNLIVHRRQLVQAFWLCVALGIGLAPSAEAAQRYVGAMVDQAGELRIVAADGRIETIRNETEQVGLSKSGSRLRATPWVGSACK